MSLEHLSRGATDTFTRARVMALSSGGWAAPATVPASSQQATCGGPIPTACCSTVLMSVRVSVCHSGIRPLCLPGAGSEALRLQLSMDPSRAGEFRLALRDMSGNRSVVRLHRIDVSLAFTSQTWKNNIFTFYCRLITGFCS